MFCFPGDIWTNVAWTYETFLNNFRIKHKFKNYIKESCWFSVGLYFLFSFFSKNILAA